jgi:hypothetical protein
MFILEAKPVILLEEIAVIDKTIERMLEFKCLENFTK